MPGPRGDPSRVLLNPVLLFSLLKPWELPSARPPSQPPSTSIPHPPSTGHFTHHFSPAFRGGGCVRQCQQYYFYFILIAFFYKSAACVVYKNVLPAVPVLHENLSEIWRKLHQPVMVLSPSAVCYLQDEMEVPAFAVFIFFFLHTSCSSFNC